MNKDTLENKIGMSLWKFIIGISSIATTIIGGIFWLASVQITAQAALAKSIENTAKIESMQNDITAIKINLASMSVDIKYIVNNIEKFSEHISQDKKKGE